MTTVAERVFNLPDLGEGLTEAEIVEWLVEDQAEVSIDQNVVVVETAKATVEVPIPYAGRVATRHGSTGDVVRVGAPLITVSDNAPATEAVQGEDGDDGSGAVLIGYGTGHADQTRRRRAPRGALNGATDRSYVDATASLPPAFTQQRAPQVISPLVRKLAADGGLDLRTLRPASGTVLRRSDIESALSARTNKQSAEPEKAVVAADGDERIPLTGVRKAIAEKLSTSRREIPDATTWVDVDATELLAVRAQLKSSGISLLALLARFCVAGLQQFPELNASVDGDTIVRHKQINLGFAAQSPRGLVVPVVRGAQEMTTRRLAESLGDLTARARTGDLSPGELTGGTFTLNNYGVLGVDGSTPILNHPEAAMLGVGRIIDRPWAVDGQLAVRKVTQLGFTFDHRVCDGGSAGGFLRFIADAVEQPVRLLADC